MDVAAGALIGAFTTYVVWQLLDASPKREWIRRRIRVNSASAQDFGYELKV